MKRMMILLVLAFWMTACTEYNTGVILLPREDISFTMKGTDQFSYDPLTCQLSHNASKNEYRVFDDKLSEWFMIRCSERPENVGQTVTAELTWMASSSTKTLKNLTFKVEKTDESGMIWLWCTQKSIGIVIKNL